MDKSEAREVIKNIDFDTVDVNRSVFSKYINQVFYGKYTLSHIQPPGNLSHVMNMIHDDMQRLVTALEDRIDALEEYEFMYEGLND